MAHTSTTLLLVALLFVSASNADDETICGSLVETKGYVCEEHTVTTGDGYILSLQRMPKAGSGKAAYKPPVLLQHGLMTNGASWVLNSLNESLPFILADNGFDVWIANTRGTKYSRGHTSLSPNDMAYWEWSWDELAAFDLPAFSQYVYNQTNQKMHYVGHSLGTLMSLAALSQEKLSGMIRSAAMLSPIAHLGKTTSLLARSGAFMFLGEELYFAGLREFVPRGFDLSKALARLCNIPGINCAGVGSLVNSLTGLNCCVTPTTFAAFLEHATQPTSTKNLIHLSQMIRQQSIAKYDYGSSADLVRYGTPSPPVYNMANIPKDIPLFFGCGDQDLLSDVTDVQDLLGNLEGHQSDKLVVLNVQDYSHLDFIFGSNANQIVYNPLVSFFLKN